MPSSLSSGPLAAATQDVHHEASAMLIEIICRLCGQAYTPTAEDFRRGPEVYQRCLMAHDTAIRCAALAGLRGGTAPQP